MPFWSELTTLTNPSYCDWCALWLASCSGRLLLLLPNLFWFRQARYHCCRLKDIQFKKCNLAFFFGILFPEMWWILQHWALLRFKWAGCWSCLGQAFATNGWTKWPLKVPSNVVFCDSIYWIMSLHQEIILVYFPLWCPGMFSIWRSMDQLTSLSRSLTIVQISLLKGKFWLFKVTKNTLIQFNFKISFFLQLKYWFGYKDKVIKEKKSMYIKMITLKLGTKFRVHC